MRHKLNRALVSAIFEADFCRQFAFTFSHSLYSKKSLVTKKSAELAGLIHLLNQAGISPKAFDDVQRLNTIVSSIPLI